VQETPVDDIDMKRVTLTVTLDIGTLYVEAKSTSGHYLYRGEFLFDEAADVLKKLAKKLAPGLAAGTPVAIRADESSHTISAKQ